MSQIYETVVNIVNAIVNFVTHSGANLSSFVRGFSS